MTSKNINSACPNPNLFYSFFLISRRFNASSKAHGFILVPNSQPSVRIILYSLTVPALIFFSSEKNGFITYLSIEDGNPTDTAPFLPVINAHQQQYDKLPKAIFCDGGYASKSNVEKGRAMGVKRVVFHKRVGISYTAMGVKIKTFKKLRDFRAGVEGNISELKRAFGVSKALWKGHDGFKAFVWSSVMIYNLVRLARLQSG